MGLSFYSSHVSVGSAKKQWLADSLKKFQTCVLSDISIGKLQQSNQLYRELITSNSRLILFVFGGMGASSQLGQSFCSIKNKKVLLVDSMDKAFKQTISNLTREELKSSHFIFISKSGQTSEILFYKNLVKQLYSKKKMSLKKRVTILTQNMSSPLLLWGQRESFNIFFLEDSLPGRFSFFNLSGLFQFQACGLKVRPRLLHSVSVPPEIFEFLFSQFNRKEVFFCFFQPELKALSRWLEISWSESLFKEEMKEQAPILRAFDFPSLRHGFIEELIAKKKQVCFWGLDLKKEDRSKKSLQTLLTSKRIPYLFLEVEKNALSLFQLILIFYKVLFLAGEFAGVNIKAQAWVDYLKKQ